MFFFVVFIIVYVYVYLFFLVYIRFIFVISYILQLSEHLLVLMLVTLLEKHNKELVKRNSSEF